MALEKGWAKRIPDERGIRERTAATRERLVIREFIVMPENLMGVRFLGVGESWSG